MALVAAAAISCFAVPASALECVPYARQISGLDLRGDAWTWWTSAAGQYERSQSPRAGSVLVFKKHGQMRRGHVAVVTQVLGKRELLVDHANWAPYRGRIYRSVRVKDVSPANDWTQVRVWYDAADEYGTTVYPTNGFIHQPKNRTWNASYADAAPIAKPDVTDDGAAAPAPHANHAAPAAPVVAVAPTPAPVAAPVQVAAAPVSATAIAAAMSTVKATPAKVEKTDKKPDATGKAHDMPLAAPAAPLVPPAKAEAKSDEVWAGDLEAARSAGAGSYGPAR